MSEAAPPHTGRRVHWLELFFDLVMVACIGQIAHTMHGDPGPLAFAGFFGLLAVVWWAWVNSTVTMNLFGARVTPSLWIATSIAMIAIAFMAASVPEAFGDRAAAFAIANAVIRMIWMLPWWLKRRVTGLPWWRPIRFGVLPAAIWIASIWVPPPWTFVLWALAVAVEILMLVRLGGAESWLSRTLDVPHMVERVVLLVVIVFGESVLSIITELDLAWAPMTWLAGLLGFVCVTLLAWVFFTYATTAVETGMRRLQLRGSVGGLRDAVMYLPYLLVAGVVLLAAGLGTAVAEAAEHVELGTTVCIAAGISLFMVASTAESLRYGTRWRDVVLWGPAGVILPWVLVPLAEHMTALALIGSTTILIVILVTLNVVNVRRMRRLGTAATTAP
jgi:low temperature requirement protein LtrA